MSLTITVNFTPVAPVPGKTFQALRVELTDGGGTVRQQNFTLAQIQASAVAQPDGSYSLPVTYSPVGVGAYTVTSQAVNASDGSLYGPVASSSGTVALADGVWIPSPVSVS